MEYRNEKPFGEFFSLPLDHPQYHSDIYRYLCRNFSDRVLAPVLARTLPKFNEDIMASLRKHHRHSLTVGYLYLDYYFSSFSHGPTTAWSETFERFSRVKVIYRLIHHSTRIEMERTWRVKWSI